MKKMLVPVALALGFAGAAQAQSAYTIYGLLDGSFGKNIIDGQEGPDGNDRERVGFHSGGDSGSSQGNSTTRVGLKGTTDLGSGIKANFQLETGGISSDGKVNGDSTFFNRQAWFGASGAFGEVRLGRQDSIPFQTYIGYDFNGASNGVSAWAYSGVATAHFGRQSGSLQYISPTMGGFKGQFGVQLKNKADKDAGGKDVVSGAVTYGVGGLSVSAAFQSKEGTGNESYAGVYGSYDFGVAKVSLGYNDTKSIKGITVGAQATVAGINVGAIYAAQTENKITNDKGSVIELFVNKEVLKGTYAYAELGIADKKVSGGKGTGYAVGVIYTF